LIFIARSTPSELLHYLKRASTAAQPCGSLANAFWFACTSSQADWLAAYTYNPLKHFGGLPALCTPAVGRLAPGHHPEHIRPYSQPPSFHIATGRLLTIYGRKKMAPQVAVTMLK
jgi:hypothetical protein